MAKRLQSLIPVCVWVQGNVYFKLGILNTLPSIAFVASSTSLCRESRMLTSPRVSNSTHSDPVVTLAVFLPTIKTMLNQCGAKASV